MLLANSAVSVFNLFFRSLINTSNKTGTHITQLTFYHTENVSFVTTLFCGIVACLMFSIGKARQGWQVSVARCSFEDSLMERCHTEAIVLCWFEKSVDHPALGFHEYTVIFKVKIQFCVSVHLESDY